MTENGFCAHQIPTDTRIPLLKIINGQKVFSFRGAKLWNRLESETKCPRSENIQRTTIEGVKTLISSLLSFL